MVNDLMRDGDEWLIFTRNPKLIGRIIRFFTGSWSSHVAYVKVIDGEIQVYDADFIPFIRSRVSVTSWENWRHKNYRKAWVFVKGEVDWRRVNECLGKRYALKDLLKHVFIRWWKWNKTEKDYDTFTCYKFAAYISKLPKWWKSHGKHLEDLLLEK